MGHPLSRLNLALRLRRRQPVDVREFRKSVAVLAFMDHPRFCPPRSRSCARRSRRSSADLAPRAEGQLRTEARVSASVLRDGVEDVARKLRREKLPTPLRARAQDGVGRRPRGGSRHLHRRHFPSLLSCRGSRGSRCCHQSCEIRPEGCRAAITRASPIDSTSAADTSPAGGC